MTTPILPPKLSAALLPITFSLILTLLGVWNHTNEKTLDAFQPKIDAQAQEIVAVRERLATLEAHFTDIKQQLNRIEKALDLMSHRR